jgi:hypothetical protein
MEPKDQDYYLRLSESVGDKELKGYYRDRAAEVQKSAVSPEIQKATQAYIAQLRRLGVEMSGTVTVEVH